MDTNKDEFFEEIYEVHNWDCKLLWAGFTIIVKDLNEYICFNAFSCRGIDCFLSVYADVLTEDRFYFKKCSPNLFKSLQSIDLEYDIALKASVEDFEKGNLENISEENLQWLSYPGWALSKAFRNKLIPDLCGSKIPFKEYEEGRIKKEELVEAIMTHLAENHFTKEKFWYPFLIYLSLLIIKTSKRPFCGGDNESCC